LAIADEAAGEDKEGFVDVRAAFVAGAQAPVLVQPGECALDDPAFPAKSRAVRCVAFGDVRFDAASVEELSVWLGVVAAVGEESVRSAPWSAALASDGRDRLDERVQLGDVVAVGAG
jgi:hypothetical protein